MHLHAVALVALVLLPFQVAARQTSPASWIDRPLSSWNKAGATLPEARSTGESRTELIDRCKLNPRRSTPPERALAAAGWIPFLHVDRQLVEGDIEIIDGMIAADGMCRPGTFNVFVFVGSRFAGTLSPAPMTSRLDGSIGAVRIVAADAITAEFARYREQDPLCCPSSHVTVRFRIERMGADPVVTPVDVRTTRDGNEQSRDW
jgi:hypothetical protein